MQFSILFSSFYDLVKFYEYLNKKIEIYLRINMIMLNSNFLEIIKKMILITFRIFHLLLNF